MHKRIHDITGNRYGSLVVLYPVSKQREDGSAVVWRCRCDCGKETNVLQSSLVAGNKKSCGCLKEKTQQSLSEQFEMVDGTCVEWLRDRKRRTDNKTGCKGVFRKKNGKYSASIGFKKKVFHIGTYETLDQAVEARKEAEDQIFGSFLESYRNWKRMAEQDPEWEQDHPFRFDVEKRDGRLKISDSMRDYLETVSNGNVTVIQKLSSSR